MDNGTYKRNVFKTLAPREAKLGLKFVARNTKRTNVMHAVAGIATKTLDLAGILGPYMVGATRINDTMKIAAFDKASELTYFMTIAAKLLKVKVPGSGKKVKLKGQTRSEALVKLVQMAGELSTLANQAFEGPVMVAKEVTRKAKDTGESITTVVNAVDMDASESKAVEREHQLAAVLSQYIDLFWAVCFDTFEVPPANLYVATMAKMEKHYGKGYFDSQPEQTKVAVPAPKAAKAPAKAKKATPQPVAA
jgi:hypothetical protein